MSCRMLIEISIAVDGRGAGRKLEDELTRIAHDRGTDVGIRTEYEYGHLGHWEWVSDVSDTCDEAMENVTGITYGMGDPKPIVLGEDTGDIAHGLDDWRACRNLRLYQTWMAKQERAVDDAELIEAYNSPYDDSQPCPDATDFPPCTECPHRHVLRSVSPPASESTGPVAGS